MRDWRLNNVKGLQGLQFQRKRYTKWSDSWDHDHCAACWAKFAEFDGPGIQREGYATCDDYKHGAAYDWVCVSCFAGLQEAMGWVSVENVEN